jgi:hypothetical protein
MGNYNNYTITVGRHEDGEMTYSVYDEQSDKTHMFNTLTECTLFIEGIEVNY